MKVTFIVVKKRKLLQWFKIKFICRNSGGRRITRITGFKQPSSQKPRV